MHVLFKLHYKVNDKLYKHFDRRWYNLYVLISQNGEKHFGHFPKIQRY